MEQFAFYCEPRLFYLSAAPGIVGVKVEVGCIIFVHSDEWPYLGLSADVIQCLAKINAALDYDIYPPDIYPPSSDDN